MSELRDSARWLSRQLAEGKETLRSLSFPQLGNSSIEAGKIEEYDNQGTLVSVVGEQFDGTHAAVTFAGPVPPEPVAASVTPGINSAEVRWNGKFVDDALSPMDFSHVSVHASRFESYDPDGSTQKATISGESGDSAALALESGEWYIVLVAVSKAGKWSTPSEAVLVEVVEKDELLDALIDLDVKYDGVVSDAAQLDFRLGDAEDELVAHTDRLDTAESDLNNAFGQLGTVDSRVAAAKQEAIDAGATYTDEQAEAAKFAAISAMAFSRNPSFDDWTGVVPAGYGTWGNYAPTKETGIVRLGKNAARWDCTDATNNRGMNIGTGVLYDLPAGVEYWTVEVSFQLVSGTTLNGAGVLLDWAGMTSNRAVLSLSAEVPTPITGKWYTISKTLQRPANATGTNTGMAGYLMSNYGAGLGGLAVKDIVWDWFNVRPATAEEINAGLALTMAGSKSRVYYNTSPASGVPTADGDLWRQRDANNNIIAEWRWNGTPPAGSWVQTAISSQAISNLDLGKLTAGSATMLQATIDKLVASTASFQRVDVRNLFATTGTMDTAVIDKLWADVVNSRKIATSMLAVADLTDFAPSYKDSPDDWTMDGGMQCLATGIAGAYDGLRFTSRATTGSSPVQRAMGPKVAVQPGDELYAEGTIYRASGTDPIYLRWYFYSKTVGYVTSGGTELDGTATVQTLGSGQKQQIKATVPTTGVMYAQVVVTMANSSGVDMGMYNVRGMRRNKGELLVDGSIDGKVITGATVRTAASGARIVLDSTGLNGWDASNVNYLKADSTGITITGTMTAQGDSSVNYLNTAMGPRTASVRSGTTLTKRPGLSFYPNGESSLNPVRVRSALMSDDGVNIYMQGGEPVGFVPDGASTMPASVEVGNASVTADAKNGTFTARGGTVSISAGLSKATMSGTALELTARNSAGVKISSGGPVTVNDLNITTTEFLAPLMPAGWTVEGDFYIDRSGSNARASMTIKVIRTGGAFSMSSGSYTTIGAIGPTATRSATGVQTYSPGFLNGGSAPLNSVIFYNPSSGLLLIKPESTVTVGTNWSFTFAHAWTI